MGLLSHKKAMFAFLIHCIRMTFLKKKQPKQRTRAASSESQNWKLNPPSMTIQLTHNAEGNRQRLRYEPLNDDNRADAEQLHPMAFPGWTFSSEQFALLCGIPCQQSLGSESKSERPGVCIHMHVRRGLMRSWNKEPVLFSRWRRIWTLPRPTKHI